MFRCIKNSPITLISGRGGTGKTEVVSLVLGDAERMMSLVDSSVLTEDGSNGFLTPDRSKGDSLLSSDNESDNLDAVKDAKKTLGPTDYFSDDELASAFIEEPQETSEVKQQ